MLAKSVNVKNRSIVLIDDGVNLYSSRCMCDPNYIALAPGGVGGGKCTS